MTNPTPHGQVPEALRLAEQYDHGDPAAHGNAWKAAVCTELRRQHARIAELEAEIAAVGAGGVQALSAAPEAIAKLRHLYQNMVNGAVRDTASAKRIAEGLLAPAIEALERATPQAEQATTPKAGVNTRAALGGVYAELPRAGAIGYVSVVDVDSYVTRMTIGPRLPGVRDIALWTTDQLRGFADRTHALRMEQAAPKAAPVEEPVMIYHGRCTIDCGEHGHHDMEMLRMIPSGSKLYTAPQPAPAPLSDDVVRDAARYRRQGGKV